MFMVQDWDVSSGRRTDYLVENQSSKTRGPISTEDSASRRAILLTFGWEGTWKGGKRLSQDAFADGVL